MLAAGIDPEAAAALLRQQVEVQLAREGIAEATAEAVVRVLVRQNSPGEESRTPSAGRAERRLGWFGRLATGFLGVLLPLITLGIEAVTHMCADFFDPIPTPIHLVAILLVAVANGMVLAAVIRRPATGAGLARILALQAAAMGVAAFYSLWFAPMTPFAVVGILFVGLGLLPLAPLLSLLTACYLRRRLRKGSGAGGPTGPFWPWFAAGFGVLILLELPAATQAWAVRAVRHGDAGQQARALGILRQYGSEERLLRSCHRNSDDEQRRTIYGWLFGASRIEDYQLVYYRVTGRPFNHRPAPSQANFLGRRGAAADAEEWIWDEGQGGVGIGRRLKALYLTQSRIDGSANGDAATGYLEWTMVFRNDHRFQQREARSLVQLPAGAVVSRLTLWIDGEEREAAFGGRSQVRQAYQAVVQQRRDPVLVTTAGPDRVLVQCFPIQPNGGEMKIRIGITVPLLLDSLASARLVLPRVIEQNYSPVDDLRHAVWVESANELSSLLDAYRPDQPREGRHALRGILTPAQFVAPAAGLAVARSAASTRAWTPHPFEPDARIEQTIEHLQPAPAPLVIAIDGSGDLAQIAPVLADALAGLPPTRRLKVLLAGESPRECPAEDPRAVAAWLREMEFVGGQDSAQTLQAAVDLLGEKGGTLLWIHGTQPVAWFDSTALEQVLARKKGRVRLLAFAAVAGPNVLLDKLNEPAALSVLPRYGEVGGDLARALDRLEGRDWVAVRRVISAGGLSSGVETSRHLARLWAADEVIRLLSAGQVNRDAAVKLAVQMQLVTPMTGAVVLETKQQYAAANLKPVDPSTVPTVPEKGVTLLLLAGGLAAVALLARHRRRSGAPALGSG